ncbi:GPR1/FUN34/yaaH family-domain-containing protein [Cantharellus anzutake]|uniref:GPR1/FUN34/yaaH family-domain-containing protein n=1 Tax=Cantharellus anzutake TaxID=1750568 RepID=UPI001908905D|nr:GPR1/FUN34/yaaH family-domain-containing protein [Cantharellus anzutake]KAF8326981.1 GPR1/FUN34/yaaH family-domain-containing protein [Cantharellus anzutake]
MSYQVSRISSSDDTTVDRGKRPEAQHQHVHVHHHNEPTAEDLQRVLTPGGHWIDYSQTPLPPAHRKHGNPAPLGLLSFGTGFFMASAFTLNVRGVHVPNMVVPVLIFFGGIMQLGVGLWEMFTGSTFGATVFSAYGSFNLTYAGIFLPALGVIDAYVGPDGKIDDQFDQAVAIYLFAWMMVSLVFLVGALRTNAAIISTLVCASVAFCFFAIHSMNASNGARIAGSAFGIGAAACAWWAALSGFWTRDSTFTWVRVNPIDLSRKD